MFKSAVPSVAPSASASASSHDTHSLPPAFKGPVQRFFALSIPTVTLTPEFVDILDSVDVIIPSRIQVTIRWWNEDTSSSLSVHPRLNSPFPPSVEEHQSLLRQQQLEQEEQQQEQQQQQLHNERVAQAQQQQQQQRSLSAIASNSAQPSSTTQTQPRSMAAKFLRRPWTAGGARIMNVLRIGHNRKSKGNKASSPKTPLDDSQQDDALRLKDERRQDILAPILTLNPPLHADGKPLPTLPDAAFPVTVAYPVRCSLDQLYRYFLEMTSLTLEIQITPNLVLLASVPNLADLFRNIHGTFSGVFTFTKVLQNDNPQLVHHKIFTRKTVLGMVVFQAWCQDTSDIGDTSEGSESASNASIHLDHNIRNDQPTTHQHPPHHTHGSVRHHRQPSHHHFGHPSEHSSTSYRHHPPPTHQQQQQSHRFRPSLVIPPIQQQSVHPLSPHAVDDPRLLQHQHQKAALPSHHGHHQRGGSIIDGQAPAGSRHHDSHGHQTTLRFDDEPSTYLHHRFPSHPQPHPIGPSRMPHEDQHHSGKSGGRQQDVTGAAGVGSMDSLRQYPNIKPPVHDANTRRDATYRKPVRNSQRRSQDDSLYQHRRSEDTNTTTRHSHSSRSRPRAGATAAAIGRLDTVLARGEDLLKGMKTSLALDPEEVRTRSARHLRPSVLKDEASRFRPYHESLPYWPSKSRFSLELSIPTAYLTSHGLLKGSRPKKTPSLPLPGQQLKHRQPHRSQQHQQQATTPSTVATTAERVRSPRHMRQPSRDSRGGRRQEYWASTMGGRSREVSLGGEDLDSTPRSSRSSGKPIELEKVARKSDLARLQLAQEESAAQAHYQSFQSTSSNRQQLEDQQDKEQRRRGREGSSSSHPRKSKSYPPSTFATKGSESSRLWKQHRRRLSSNDRLQIRMNPRPGDLLNDTPDLFPSRSMSGLVRPEYYSSVAGSSFSGAEDSSGQSYSRSTEDEDSRFGGGAMGGRQSRLQRRRRVPSVEEEDEERERHPQRRERDERTQDNLKDSRRRRRKHHEEGHGHGQGQGKPQGWRGVHAQHFNFKAQCQLMLTPEVMAACMLENISVEVWKLNPKRQTMIELGTAKLPLHKVLSRILQKTASGGAHSSGSKMREGGAPQDAYHDSSRTAGMRSWQQQRGDRTAGSLKEGWRLEPSMYDIRSRQGTVIGQLDADVWIHPRSRSDSMVSAAA
ncbi:hypothetical protein BGX24_007973 [Mortierella sp. AD032]|nr:hypothetical protein BGX24_007973 [Mortierella sp. AD032]